MISPIVHCPAVMSDGQSAGSSSGRAEAAPGSSNPVSDFSSRYWIDPNLFRIPPWAESSSTPSVPDVPEEMLGACGGEPAPTATATCTVIVSAPSYVLSRIPTFPKIIPTTRKTQKKDEENKIII